MPLPVDRVTWVCPQCGAERKYLPCVAKLKKFCSRACHHASKRRVDSRERPKVERSYGERVCVQCGVSYVARHNHQKVCSVECSVARAQAAVRLSTRKGPRLCPHCQKEFTPKRTDGAGKFCSWQCKIDGQKGAHAGSWKGGRHVTNQGYVRIWRDSLGDGRHGNYVFEHRAVMEEILKRPLRSDETVHHIDGDGTNNAPENLQLRVGRHGKGARLMCADCGSHNLVPVPLQTGADLLKMS